MVSLLTRLQRALEGRYSVEHELGRGGMATVVLGRDLKLDRRVAIKVYEQDGVVSTGERFLREIRIAAKLQHPNILPVHDSGEGEGLVYYVMPYVAGASLRERIEREGPLPIADAIRIAREVAEALDHAHRAGIIHRDIKPDNIMLADGVAVVADFGIARAIEESGGKVTDTGLAIGTPNYMSPEQAAAQPNLDGRTDLYSLGCVLYEMLAGVPPFSGATAQAVMARHATDAVPPLSTVRPVPDTLASVVAKALAKIPADRWGSGKAMADALSLAAPTTNTLAVTRQRRPTIWLGVAAAVVLAAAVWKLMPARGTVSAAEAPVRSVAVLPVTVRGDTSLLKYADGMTEAVITGLSRLEGISMPGSNRVFPYRDRQNDVQAVGRELGVEVVLAGNLQEAGGTLRYSVQLINVRDGLVRWTQQYDGSAARMFEMQDSVTLALVDGLRLHLAPGARASAALGTRTRDSVAHSFYLQAGRASRVPGRKAGELAVALYQKAVERDSMYSDAWAALAEARDGLNAYAGTPSTEGAAAVRHDITRAIDTDSTNAFAFVLRARQSTFYDWDWDAARRDMQRAVKLAPSSSSIMANYSWTLTFLNELDSALVYAHRAVALDSRDPDAWLALASRYYALRMGDSAIAAAEHGESLDREWLGATEVLYNAYLDAGRRADAARVASRVEHSPLSDHPGEMASLTSYYARAGETARARAMLDLLTRRSRQQYVPPSLIAGARDAVGDIAGSLDALEEAVRVRDAFLPTMLIFHSWHKPENPRWDAVRRKVYGNRPIPKLNY